MTEDHIAIQNLLARYAELLNLGQVDEVAKLFRYGKITLAGSQNEYAGSDQIAEMYRSKVHFSEKLPDTLLFTSNIQTSIDGDEAASKAYFTALFQMNGAITPVVAGRYHDQFRRIGGEWWFVHRHMITDLVGDTSTHIKGAVPVAN